MKHKLYLNIQNFLTDFIFTTTLHGKYALVEQQIDLTFHRRFTTFDEYLVWATRQIFANLETYTRLIVDGSTDIQKLYQLMDSARTNPEILFDIEQTLRTILPFSLYMDNKDSIYEAYFELIECFLEDLLLFQSLNPSVAEPVGTKMDEDFGTCEPEESVEESEELDDSRIENELKERLSCTTSTLLIEQPETKLESDTESETESNSNEIEPESEESETEPETKTETSDTLYHLDATTEEQLKVLEENFYRLRTDKSEFASLLVHIQPLIRKYLNEPFTGKGNKAYFILKHNTFVRVPCAVFDAQVQSFLSSGNKKWSCPMLPDESTSDYERRWRKEIYSYALQLKRNGVIIHKESLKQLDFSVAQFVYLMQYLLKCLMCNIDGWKKSDISSSTASLIFRILIGDIIIFTNAKYGLLYDLVMKHLNLNGP